MRQSRSRKITVTEDEDRIQIITPTLEAVVRKRDYVTGVAGGSFLDRKTGFRDAGFGLDIVDWIMAPGGDESYRASLPPQLVYEFDNQVHGRTAKRCIEGPQICTQAKELQPEVIHGKDFVGVRTHWKFTLAAPGMKAGSEWEQTLVFPEGERFFLSCDRITTVNPCEDLFLRIDLPGHIRHERGDTFGEIYLSYVGHIPSTEFFDDFPPDTRFNYRREVGPIPERFIRAYRLRDAATDAVGPYLAGMTLEPSIVTEAWCHQRGYVCFIEEFGLSPDRPALRAGESFSGAFIVGFFDTVEEMHDVYDRYAGHTGLMVEKDGWRLL